MKKIIILSVLFFFILSCVSNAKQMEVLVANDSLIHSDTLNLLFVGDLMQHQAQIDAAKTTNGYDYSSYFKYVKDEINNVDLAVGNLEVTLGGKPYQGYPTFSAPDEYLYAIRNAGFDVLATANNHCLDKGKKGLERTIRLLDSLQIPRMGTYLHSEDRDKKYPLLLEKKGFRIALLNYTYGTNEIKVTHPNLVNYIDTVIISKDIQACRAKQPDAIIACLHWGIEYKSLPGKEQLILTEWLLAKGVHHIIGSHPHVVQPMEVRQDSLTGNRHLIVYSLGNFISNMSARNTDGGVMVKMQLLKDSTIRMNDCSYSLVWTARPIISGKKNHILLPISDESIDVQAVKHDLPPNATVRFRQFIEESRSLFKQYNKGIAERNISF